MFYYKRKTSFIEYYINGIKSKCIGIVKQKVTEEGLWCSIELSGLEEWKTMLCKISVGNARTRQEVATIRIEGGRCREEIEIPLKEIQTEQCKKLFIDLGNDCYGITDLCELPRRNAVNKEVQSKEIVAEDDIDTIIAQTQEETDDTVSEHQGMGESSCNDIKDLSVQTDEIVATEEDTISEVLCDCLAPQPDKWEVIKKKYPILYPFRGQGPYVSIKPVDLQLLDEKYHKLTENSFLMHAFYQYRHMILGEYEQDGSTYFYVGVPGEFVKKEQESAAMFGFEGYEHSGDLGYYLYRVEL